MEKLGADFWLGGYTEGLILQIAKTAPLVSSVFLMYVASTHARVLANAPIHLSSHIQEAFSTEAKDSGLPRLAERIKNQTAAHRPPQTMSLNTGIWVMIFGHRGDSAIVNMCQKYAGITM